MISTTIQITKISLHELLYDTAQIFLTILNIRGTSNSPPERKTVFTQALKFKIMIFKLNSCNNVCGGLKPLPSHLRGSDSNHLGQVLMVLRLRL